MKEFKDNEALLNKLIYAAVNKFSLDEDDVRSEATRIFLKAIETHDPSASKLSTWICTKVRFGLLDYAKKVWGRKENPIDEPSCGSYLESNINDVMESASAAASFVMELVLNGEEFSCNGLKRKLEQMGWKQKATREAFVEVREIVNNF